MKARTFFALIAAGFLAVYLGYRQIRHRDHAALIHTSNTLSAQGQDAVPINVDGRASDLQVEVQHEEGDLRFEAIRSELGERGSPDRGSFKPPFSNLPVYAIRRVSPKGSQLVKEFYYNDILNAGVPPGDQQGRIQDSNEKLAISSAWINFLAYDPVSQTVCLVSPLDDVDRTMGSEVYIYNIVSGQLKSVETRFPAASSGASIAPSGHYLALRIGLSEDVNGIELIDLQGSPKSLGLLMRKEDSSYYHSDQVVLREHIVGWEEGDRLRISRHVGLKTSSAPPSRLKASQEDQTILIDANDMVRDTAQGVHPQNGENPPD